MKRVSSTFRACRAAPGGSGEWSHSSVSRGVRELLGEDAEGVRTGNGFGTPSTARTRHPIATKLGRDVVLGLFFSIDVEKSRLSIGKSMMR